MIKVRALDAGGTAEILIYDPIGQDFFGDGVVAKGFIEDLDALGDVQSITVRINSPGGVVWDGFAIYNALKDHPAEVHVRVDGLAASIASVIAMSGDTVTMGEGAMLMVHNPWSLAMGDANDLRGAADMLDKVKEGLVHAYAWRTGLDRGTVADLMEAETWFTAAEAVAHGFADERIEAEPVQIAARASWAALMARYKNAPKSFTRNEVRDMKRSKPKAGARLASLLNNAIDAIDSSEEDTRSRADVISAMGSAAGISAGTVNQILDGDINCPPLNRLEGFASVDGLPALSSQRSAAESDGCEYDDEGQARACVLNRDFTSPRNAGPTQSASAGATSKEGVMPQGKAPASVQTTDNSNPNPSEKDVLARESTRRADIRAAFGRYGEDHRPLLDECLDDVSCSVDSARSRLLAKLAEGAEPMRGDPAATAGVDAREKFVEGASKAIMARAGLADRERGNEFNGMTLASLAGVALQRAGINVRGMSPDQVARKVLASMSTSDFPNLLANTAGKLLRNAYDVFPSTWQQWCGVRDVSDFKQVKNIQMGAFDNLALIPEGGEFEFGSFAEEAESNIALTKGKGLKMTRQMIVNDDLGGFNRAARMLGAAAARTVNSDAYSVLTTNAALSDSVALFHATHNNLLSAGAITVDNLSKGKAAMRKQKDKGSKDYLNIQPANLLVPVALEDTAREIITSTTKDGQTNAAKPNVLRNFVEVISDPKLDEDSVTAWYLTADPALVELVQAVFLDGQQTPFIDDDVDFMSDALLFKVRLDYGFAAVDYRAGQKNAGA